MYQALYRKWRSRTFSEMVGQQAVIRTLRHQVDSGRVAHAYLFCGSRGTGKTSAAKIMARAINCLHPVNGDPCLTCESCLALENDASLDVFEMDAASNSRVEEIRELLERVDYPPQFSKYKVYIIDEVHMLSNAAFNALLKTLEEPPAYMVFILATTEPQKLPATILSRCQRFDFGRLTDEQMISRIRDVLPEMADAEPGALSLIARAADGSMRDAWSLLDMCIGSGERLTEKLVRDALGTADSDFLFAFTGALGAGDGRRALEEVDQLMRDGRDVQVFLRDFAAHARRLAACKLGALPPSDMEADARLRPQAEGLSLARLLRMLELSMQAEADTRYASSPRAVLELFALRACRAGDGGGDSAALEARVEELETALALLMKNGVPAPAAGSEEKKSAPVKAAKPVKAAPALENAAAPTGAGKRPQDVWNAALKRLAKESLAIYAIVNQGRFGGYQNGAYRLRFSADAAISRDFVAAPERRALIERLLKEEGGEDAQLEITVEKQTVEGLEEAQRRDESMLIEAVGRAKVQLDD